MGYGISKLSIIPGRYEPSDKAESVTQVLFGEYYEVLDEQDKWIRIKLSHDGYEFWIDRKQHTPLSQEDFDYLESNESPRTLDLLGIAKDKNRDNYHNLPLGSRLPFFENKKFHIGKSFFNFKGTLAVQDVDNLIPYAHLYLNAPYLWGGRTPFGIDCSGYMQMCFMLVGIPLPRDSYQQAECGNEVKSIDKAIAGDLAFFANEEGKINHVGLMISGDEIIHASGQVRIDKIDKRGIYNAEMRGYSHNLERIRRVI